MPGDGSDTKLNAKTLTALEEHPGERFVRRLCMHCVEPSCASVCPVSALKKTPEGPVTYNASVCLGCRYCMVACPFDVPTYEYAALVPSVKKCDFCTERFAKGEANACATTCPVEATVAGTRAQLLGEATKRIRQEPDKYVGRIFGETEVGGTSVFFLSKEPFETLGFKQGLGAQPLPDLTWNLLEKIPAVVSIGGATLFSIWWIIRRRQDIAALEKAGELRHDPH